MSNISTTASLGTTSATTGYPQSLNHEDITTPYIFTLRYNSHTYNTWSEKVTEPRHGFRPKTKIKTSGAFGKN